MKFINNDTAITLSNIKKFYCEHCDNEYVPGILSFGSLYDDSEDFYAKLIFVKAGTDINQSWFIDNLSPSTDKGAFNVICDNNYKYKKIHNINPVLQTDEISYVEQVSRDFFDIEYIGGKKRIHNKKVLKMSNKTDVYVLRDILADYYEDKTFSLDYRAYIEIEYRTYIDGLSPTMVGESRYDGGYVDLIYEQRDNLTSNKSLKSQMFYWIRATIPVDLTFKTKEIKSESNIKVLDISTQQMRSLNDSNYDDDINAGLIIYERDAIKILRKYYYFYSLSLLPKTNELRECLIDELEDCVVFWEGEYNSNLPEEIKKEIEPYNLIDKKEGVISNAMYDWQLMGKWDINSVLFPNQRLARFVLEKYRNKAFEMEMDFSNPFNTEEYSIFIKKILELLNIKIERLNLKQESYNRLLFIISNEYVFKDNSALINDYRGFCYLLLKVIEDEQRNVKE